MAEANLYPAEMSKRTQFIVAVGLVAGVLYLFSDSSWVETITKPIPVLCMALVLALQLDKARYQWAVIAGLLLSATADVVISLHFIAGVAVFFLAHVAYIIAFLQDSRKPFLGRAVLAFGYGVIVYFYLMTAGDLGALAVPILLYALVITTMVWRAAARVGVAEIAERSGWSGFLGAAFFVLSDTLLIIGMVVRPIPLGDYLVMLTYWLGQLGISLSAVWQRSGRTTNK
jgi:alkenylglycerophosphocholine/alkenylglycerophosphoethanolamine hydrolase